MKRILRLEGINGKGPFNQMLDGIYTELLEHGAQEPPPCQEDIAGWMGFAIDVRAQLFCGFRDEDQMFAWFKPELIEILGTKYNIHVYEYMIESNHVFEGRCQLVFFKNKHTSRTLIF
jgi:hypothetical protein